MCVCMCVYVCVCQCVLLKIFARAHMCNINGQAHQTHSLSLLPSLTLSQSVFLYSFSHTKQTKYIALKSTLHFFLSFSLFALSLCSLSLLSLSISLSLCPYYTQSPAYVFFFLYFIISLSLFFSNKYT